MTPWMQNLLSPLRFLRHERDSEAASAGASFPQVSGVLGADEFREEIEREMFRCERTGSVMTLVVFTPEPANGARGASLKTLERLGRVVCRLSRRSDSRGWRQDRGNRVGVGLLLHDTAPSKASRATSQIVEAFAHSPVGRNGNGSGAVWLRHEVYAYPAEDAKGLVDCEDSHVERGPLSTEDAERHEDNGKPRGTASAEPEKSETGPEFSQSASPVLLAGSTTPRGFKGSNGRGRS
ncbi:MAG: hypothetical protein NTW86_31155, partial [Candidatus Sumerlaeota bacterium]|nr:hypothetical protein [Candidatus Sumerlaeota bacterium]